MAAVPAGVSGHEGEGDLALRTEKCSRKQCLGTKGGRIDQISKSGGAGVKSPVAKSTRR